MFFGSMLFVYGGPAAGKTYCKAMTGGMDIDMMRGFVSSGQKCHWQVCKYGQTGGGVIGQSGRIRFPSALRAMLNGLGSRTNQKVGMGSLLHQLGSGCLRQTFDGGETCPRRTMSYQVFPCDHGIFKGIPTNMPLSLPQKVAFGTDLEDFLDGNCHWFPRKKMPLKAMIGLEDEDQWFSPFYGNSRFSGANCQTCREYIWDSISLSLFYSVLCCWEEGL